MKDSREPFFCYVKDQEPISTQAFEQALRLRQRICALVDDRAEIVDRLGLDPAIHLPQGNWEGSGGLYAAYRTVAAGDYSIINNLRLFSQIFTGFQLHTLSRDRDNPIPLEVPRDVDEQLALLASSPSSDVQRYLNLIAHLPEQLHITPPRTFGEVGWIVNGKLVNHDTLVYLERLALLAESGKLWELRNRTPANRMSWRRPRILEIGGGYGGLAHYLTELIPEARYCIVDIPESLLFSSIYLSTLWPNHANVLVTSETQALGNQDAPGFTFVPNFLFDHFTRQQSEFDLVINTLSMSEMTEPQIHHYCAAIKDLLGQRGVFFEQNQDNRPVGMLDAKSIIATCLPLRLPMSSCVVPSTQGQANLWAAHPVAPYAWRPAVPPPLPRTWKRKVKDFGRKVLQRFGVL
jgi:SAM-dependent methyltransferase